MSRQARVIFVLLSIIFILLLIQIHLKASLIDTVYTLEEMQVKILKQKAENSKLREEYLKRSSYGYIKAESERQGFVPAVVYWTVEDF